MNQEILSKVTLIKKEENSAVFVIEPLLPGFGVTVGNSLRRVLLSSLEGAAIYAIKIVNTSHEFTALPGVTEDMVEIVLNLKAIRIKLHEGDETTLKIKANGPSVIKASDIKCPANAEIMNPDQHIATLGKSAKFDAELYVNRGFGYLPTERREEEEKDKEKIGIDAIYTPIRKAHYEIEQTRVGRMTNYDKVTIEITTDGTVEPQAALEQAGKILMEHFALIAKIKEDKTKAPKADKTKITDLRQTKIEEYDFSNRTTNALLANGIKTVGGLLRISEDKLPELKGMGYKSVQEVIKKTAKLREGKAE